MNFLSHFYFDRDNLNCYHILGTVLPDLLKNADKTIVLHPEKLINVDECVNDIIRGWNRHLEVDRYFHSSDFFINHSHELKKLLAPAIEGSSVKPFFLGHIALELILDNLLVTTGKIDVDDFYARLDGCKEDFIQQFLIFIGLEDSAVFFKFYGNFKKSRYLHSYAEINQIAYALKRICMRVWKDPFTDKQLADISDVLLAQRQNLLSEFIVIFNDIEEKLAADTKS